MKSLKFGTILVAFAMATFAFAPEAFAFHDGGVAYCDGCHTMHNSSGGKAVAIKGASTQFQGVADFLLQGSDPSSTCLNCHASATGGGYHIMTYPLALTGFPANTTPGGDFAWLGIASAPGTTTSYGAPFNSKGERHGHNVVAKDYGMIADATLLTAPGGTYTAATLSCVSCHDPHSRARVVDANGTIAYNKLGAKTLPIAGSGSYGATATATEAVGVYRLLGGKNYVNEGAGYTFDQADPPVAVAPSNFNRTEAVTDMRVAYGAGMSEWCSNCHTALHNPNVMAANTKLIHPSGAGAKLATSATVWGAPTTEAGIYNAYKASGDLTNTVATSYTSLVPYEEGTTVIATLAGDASMIGGSAAVPAVGPAGCVPNGTTCIAAIPAVLGLAKTTGPSTGTENVMCLTCHRAHAGGFDSATRWQNRGEFLTIAGAWPGSDAPTLEGKGGQYSNGYTQAQYTAAMGGRSATNYATFQRSLCNKCHAKD